MRGVYAITNTLTDTVYYGQSKGMRGRLAEHRWDLARGTHPNQHLQRSWIKYGEVVFVFAPYLSVPEGSLGLVEQRCIDDAYGLGLKLFNMNKSGYEFSAEHCRHIGDVRRGISTGRKISLEHREKLDASHRTPEWRAKVRDWKLGTTHTKETRIKISEANRGRVHGPCPEETRRKISVATFGLVRSKESCAKMSKAHKGKKKPPRSAEYCKNISLSKMGHPNWHYKGKAK
jgi:group I intron endonuclease